MAPALTAHLIRFVLRTRPSPLQVPHGVDDSPVPMHCSQSVTCGDTETTRQRRPFLRFFACEEDITHQSPDTPLPHPVVMAAEPLLIIGAIAGG